jgi:hypothetical protein
MAGDWSSLNGAVGGGCTSDGVGVPPAVSRGHEAGGRSGAHGVLVKEEEREKENGGGGIGWRFLYRHVEVGDGSAEGARGDMEWGGGAWRCTRVALSASSGPTAAVAHRRRLRVWTALNRGEAGLTGGPRYSPGRRGQIRFKPFLKKHSKIFKL